ncbi:MAG: hypothetical protein B6I18_03245 [Bacteroidetes bacterium 4572_112]|nr:MAG: hypothetical protein B6I18_03245 [Bacteroidetes bacterium 4572_112]
MQRATYDNTEDKIIRFIALMDMVREDSVCQDAVNWNYSKDSTVWYIEAAINYKYAFPNRERGHLLCDSALVDVDLNGDGNTNIIAIKTAFDVTRVLLTAKFNSIESEHKFFVLADYKMLSIVDNKISMMFYYYFSKGNNVSLPDGDWAVGGGINGVGGIYNVGSPRPFLNYDAKDKISQDAYNHYFHDLNVCFTSVEGENYGPNIADYPQANQFNYSPYLKNWFYLENWVDSYVTPWPYPEYISLNYMNRYIANAFIVGDYFVNLNNKTVMSVYFEQQFRSKVVNPPDPNPGYYLQNYYYATFKFGIMHPRLLDQEIDYIQ